MGVCARLLTKEGICVVTEDTVKNIKPSVEHPVAIVLGDGPGPPQKPGQAGPPTSTTTT